MNSIIDKQSIDTIKKTDNNTSIQKQLLLERQIRITIMSLLLAALLFTTVFGTLENPFQYTFSKIGNRFNHRILFIVWAIFTGGTIEISVISLFILEKYTVKLAYYFVAFGSIFLVVSAIVPSLEEIYPLWTWIHVIAASLFALFLSLGIAPFIIHVSKENPRLRLVIKIWSLIVWIGSISWMFILGNTGIFELWFFGSVIIFLLYLSLILFEEKIIKQSIFLLKGEKDLDQGIEKIFIKNNKTNKKS